jgi:uncharacterized protein YjdB
MQNARMLLLTAVVMVSAVGCQSDATDAGEVVPPPSIPLTVVPSQATLAGGHAIRLVASLHLADGSIATPDDITWSSADAAIASVDHAGTVQALRSGRVQIVASWRDSRGSSEIVVGNPVAKKPKPCVALKASGPGTQTEAPCA